MYTKKLQSFDGTKIHYRICKQRGPWLCFVHGLTDNYTAWSYQLKYFEKKGFSTVTFDLRGHGKSVIPEKFSLKSMAGDIYEILRKEHIEKIHLISHSFGGIISLLFYNLYPKYVESLTLINSTYADPLSTNRIKRFASLKPLLNNVYFIFARTPHYKRNKHFNCILLRKWPSWRIILASLLLYTNRKTAFEFHRLFLTFDGTNILKKIRCKTLIVASEKDGYFNLDVAHHMKKAIKKSELKIVKGAGHLSIFKNPNEINKYIDDFLQK